MGECIGRIDWETNTVRLYEAAAGVANMIHIGLGGTIKGTLMEAEFRKALGLAKGELVDLPRS
jgi:hypothetical protein